MLCKGRVLFRSETGELCRSETGILIEIRENVMHLREDIEKYRKALYREYLELRDSGLSKRKAIYKMAAERLRDEDREDRWKLQEEYDALEKELNKQHVWERKRKKEEEELRKELIRTEQKASWKGDTQALPGEEMPRLGRL